MEQAFLFGDWRIEPHLNRITRGDEEKQLERKAMDVLAYVLEHAGEVVSSRELLDQVWSGRIVEKSAVHQRISKIRRALGDDAHNPEYIESIPRRGYRTKVQVTEGDETEPVHADLLSRLEALTPPFPAYDGDGRYVFVCYAHTDRAEIYPQLIQLGDAGVNVWYDEGISPGSEWTEELAHAITNCAQFLYYVSPASVASRNCRDELGFARELEKPMVAVHIEETELPGSLRLSIGSTQALLKYEIPDADYCGKLFRTLDVDAAPAQTSTRFVGTTAEQQPVRSLTKRYRAVMAVAVVALVGLGWVGLEFYGKGTAPERLDLDLRAKNSIAVLPLENLSGDAAQEYVADGMTDELISELGKLGGLNVISRPSVMRYKGTRQSVPAIAVELGVNWILAGTVAREASQIRVTVQLIDAHADVPVWSDTFDRQVSSVLASRSDIARAVATQLQLILTSDEHSTLAMSRTMDEGGYDAYLRGLNHIGSSSYYLRWGPKALDELETAVALDPEFAEAWAKLASVRWTLAYADRDLYPKARAAAEKALSLDSRLAAAHSVLGLVAHFYDFHPEAAGVSIERAVRLSPNDPGTLSAYTVYLHWQERFAETIAVGERLLRIAPLDLDYRPFQIKIFGYGRMYERALAEAFRVRTFEANYVDHDIVLMFQRRYEDAHRTRMAYLEQRGAPRDEARTAAAARGWAAGGFEGKQRALADHGAASGTPDPIDIASRYATVGEMDQAFQWLEHVIEARDPGLVFVPWVFWFDAMSPDPRFAVLLKR